MKNAALLPTRSGIRIGYSPFALQDTPLLCNTETFAKLHAVIASFH